MLSLPCIRHALPPLNMGSLHAKTLHAQAVIEEVAVFLFCCRIPHDRTVVTLSKASLLPTCLGAFKLMIEGSKFLASLWKRM